MRTVAFCEIEPYCQAVLRRHWPAVPIFGDVRELTAETLADSQTIDVICGGFPCQDISLAGKGAGIDGTRSGLWAEYARLIGEIRPRFVIVENVAALLGRGISRVLGDLAALGFDAEWHCIPASAVGAPHRRDRVWIIAYPNGEGEHDGAVDAEVVESSQLVAHANSDNGFGRGSIMQLGGLWIEGETSADGNAARTQWPSEPDVGRVAHGIPSRVDRLKALGNAVVPQVVELIGRAIMEREARSVRGGDLFKTEEGSQ